MGVESLRSAIQARAKELLPSALVEVGIRHHKSGWRDCPCSWCDKKREATVVIGSQVPRTYLGPYVEGVRDAWRADQRQKFREEMKRLEEVL